MREDCGRTTDSGTSEGNRKGALTAAYFAAFVGLGLAGAVLGPTLPGLAEQTQSGLSEVSFLFTAIALGYLAGSLFGGRQYDRVPGNLLMAAGLLGVASTLAMAPLFTQLWVLIPIVVILGMTQGAVDVGGNTLIVWVHGRKVGPYMSGLHFFWGLGAFLSPIVVGQALLLAGDIAWAFWMLAALLLPVAIWLLRLPSPTMVEAAPAGVVHSPATDRPARGTSERTVVLLVVLLLFLFVGAEAGFGGWIYSYALALDLTSATGAAYLTSAFWGALTVGRLLGIPISSRVRPRWILLADALGCLVSAGILILWPTSQTAAWMGTTGMGLFMASIFPVALTLAERRVAITGKITGWFLVGASTGGMTLPLLMGQLFESVGPQSAIVLLSGYLILALCVLISLLLYSEH
jgi:FHS family Na+ dependent glucose MFS transporter 1